jgi:hypothetical protein
MRDERIRSDEDVRPRDEDWPKALGESREEGLQAGKLTGRQNRKTRQRPSLAAVERRRDPPHATAAVPHFFKLLRGVFDQSVRRVGDDRVDRIVLGLGQPLESVRTEDAIEV